MDLRKIADIYPLSPLQEYQLWRHRQGTSTEVQLGQLSCRLTGKLDVPRLAEAWQQTLNRHSILRTFFVWEKLDKPLQLIPKQLAVTVETHDWSGLPSAANGGNLSDYLETERKRGFDPSRAPLERLSVCRISDDLHQLICTYHPLVLDEPSARTLMGEVFDSYEERDGAAKQRPEQYKSYVEWLKQQEAAEAMTFWPEALEGFTLPARFLSDRHPELPSFDERDWQRLTIPAETLARLFALAEQHHLSLEEVLQAAWAMLLGGYSDASDVLFGIQVAGRPASLPSSSSMIGAFSHSLPLRARLRADLTPVSLLQQIGERRIHVRQFEDGTAPRGRVAAESAMKTPLFESILAVETEGRGSLLRRDCHELEILETQSLAPVESPLFARVWPSDEELLVEISYDRSVFEAGVIGRMCGHLRVVLDEVAAEPHRPLSRLSLLTPLEHRQMLVDWNDTATVYPRDKGVHELFEEQAALTPEAVAVVAAGGRLTYRELNERANQLAHYLRTLGVGPEMLVGICMQRSLEMIVGLLGILKAGGAYLPLDPDYPMGRLHFMLDDAQVPVLLTQERLLEELPSHWAQVVCLDSDWDSIAEHNTDNAPRSGSAQNLIYVMYTSGSTGTPKGVSVTHQNVARLVKETNYAHFQRDDVFLQLAPFSFDASTFEIWGALLNGAKLVVMSAGTPSLDEIGEAIQAHGITTVWFTAGLFHLMVNERLQDLSGLRQLLAGGDVLSVPHAEKVLCQLKGGNLINGYGPTESTTFACCYTMTRDEQIGTTIPIGRPIANTQVYIVNRQMQPLAIGVAGELLIGGDGLARGYLNCPELTAERFVPNPFSAAPGARLYRTGDLARYLPDGRIEFLGRIDSQVKVRGFRVELGEIEAVLAGHATIRDAVVIAREDGTSNKRLVAYVVTQGETDVSELRAYMKGKLPDYMLPSAVVMLDALPLNPNGKVDRAALPSPDVTRSELEASFAPPTTAAEQALADIWEQVLGLDRIGIHDNFFDLGGDSIRSIQVRAQALQHGLDLSVQQIFQHQTICELARAAETIGPLNIRPDKSAPFSLISEEDLLLMPADVEDAYPLSRLQAGMLFHSELNPDSAVYHDLFSFHIKVPRELETLQEAIRWVIARHPVLRTSFDLTSYSEPLQLVHREAEAAIEVSDLSHLSPAEQEDALALRFEAEKGLSFDWNRAPLLRFKVCLRSKEAMQFDLSFHHAILDGWSLASMLTELFQVYFALLEGASDSIPPAPAANYRDFIALERETLESEESQRFWNELLLESPVTLLPRWPTPACPKEVQQLPVAIPEDVSDGLKMLAQTSGVPVKSVLLAAHLRVMSLLAGQRDVVTGVISNGRPEEMDGERVLGLFLNTLPFRLKLEGGTWRELVKQTFQAEHKMVPFRRYPMAELQRTLGGRDLFETCFNFTHFHVYQGVLHLEGISAVSMKHFEESNFPFAAAFSLDLNTSRILLRLDYIAGDMNDKQMLAIGDYYVNALAAMAREPDAGYETCVLLSTLEQRQLLTDWNNTARDYPHDQLIHQLFEAQAARTPAAVAVEFEDERLTYRELNERANQLAHYLSGLGVGPEVLVGIMMERSVAMVVSLLGVLKAGGAYVPLDPAYPQERLSFILSDTHTPFVLTQQHLVDTLVEQGVHVVCVDEDWEVIARESVENVETEVMGQYLAYVIYTSGSTGNPKGVMIGHRSVINLTTALHQVIYQSHEAPLRIGMNAPLVFDASVQQWAQLLCGHTLYILPEELRVDAFEFLSFIDRTGLEAFDCTPSQLRLMLELGLSERRTLKLVLVGGEAIDEALWTQLAGNDGIAFFNVYGPTECTVDTSVYKILSDSSRPTIGRPIGNVETYILDTHMRPVPVGVAGELYVGGAGLARGYLNRPELTAEKFVPHPFADGARLYRTGDRARHLPGGEIEFLGRLDNQVKIRGFRIEPGEIEATLLQQEGVREAVVVAGQDARGDKYLVAYVVAHDAALPDAGELRAFLKARLPEYMVPAAFVSLAEMPLTANGKVDRRALPAPDQTQASLTQRYVAPRTATEEMIGNIWAGVLRVTVVGVADNFFELGGHSLLATQVIARVRAAFGVELPLRALFDGPTVAELAAAVAAAQPGAGAGGRPALGRRKVAGRARALSFAQQRLWFLEQLTPGSAAYNIPVALRLTGALKVAALERSLEEIVGRHEALRTSFAVNEEQQPEQVVSEQRGVSLGVEDLSELTAEAGEAEARRLAGEEARQAFALGRGPLWRARLLRLGREEHVLLFTMHHIISDGWSLGVLVRELSMLYGSYLGGAESPLAELAVQYGDYAEWQREWLQGAALAEQLEYWRGQLGDGGAVLELPADRARPALQSYGGARQAFEISDEVSERLRELSRREGATLFMTLLAAWQGLLGRYSGQEAISVGTPIAGRSELATETLIGFFVNTLVLRTDLRGDPSFISLLQRVREVCLGAYQHQDLPFEKLVEELQPERSLSHTPLFQVMFALQNAPTEQLELAGLRLSEFSAEAEGVLEKFDLTLTLQEAGEAISGSFSYSTELFDRETIERLAHHYAQLLASIAATPEGRLSELELLSEGERQQLLVEWNRTEAEVPAQCLHELFEAQAARTPAAVAVVCEGESLTYAELNSRANQLAHFLSGLGVGPEVLVGIMMERSVAMVVSLLGVLKAGGAYVPLDPAYPAERLSFMLKDAQVPVLLTQERLRGQLPDYAGRVIGLDAGDQTMARERTSNPISQVLPESLAYMIYTSGSTGTPKGAMNTHRAIVNRLCWMQEAYRLTAADRVLQKTPFSFDVSVWEFFWPLLSGARLVMARPGGHQDSAYLVRLIAERGVTTTHFVPSMLQVFLDEPDLSGCAPLRRVICSGEALSYELQQRCFLRLGAAELHNLYGPTEAAVDVTAWACERAGGRRGVPIGRPIWNTQIYLLDRQLQPVPVGVAGELHIGGVSLARGYLHRPELTAEKFVPHPFATTPGARLYQTGDLARFLPGGEIEYLGRLDQQVKLRGFRIELGEIEATLAQHPQLREAVVMAHSDAAGDKYLVAYVVAQDGALPDGGELRGFLKARLPEYMVPGAFVVLAELPLTANGKVDRRALPAPDQTQASLTQRYVAPRTATEEMIGNIWAGVLRVTVVGVADNFFELGGHSLLATQVIARVRAGFGVELPLRALFDGPTVAELAAAVTAAQPGAGAAAARPPLERRRVEGRERALSFAQQRLWFLEQLTPGSAAYNIPVALRLKGALKVGALERSLGELVRRHETLRTSFAVNEEQQPEQVVSGEWRVTLGVEDLSELTAAASEAEARRLAGEEGQRPFALGRGPLWRARLLRLGREEHVLLFTMHHIISDGWSLGVLVRELSMLYGSYLGGAESPLAELAVQYGDYAEWQREWLQGAALAEQLEYWRGQLGDGGAVLELPADRARPALQSYGGARQAFEISDEVSERLRELSRREGATLFMTLLAAWQGLLGRYSGQEAISVGTPIAGRSELATETLIGFFVNTLVLRTDLRGDPSFISLLQRVREVCLGAYQHQDLPFEKLVEELQPERSLSHTPLFQVMFALQNAPTEQLELAGLRLSEFSAEAEGVLEKFDLTLTLQEAGEAISGSFSYSTELFDRETIERLAHHYAQLLASIAATPEGRLSELELLSEGERQQLLVEWNRTEAEVPAQCLHELFEAQAARTPAAVAVVCEGESLTYAELNSRANQLAHFLRSRKVGPESIVAILMERSVAMVVSLLGVLKAGAAYLPLDLAYPRERLAFMLEDAGIAVVLTQQSLLVVPEGVEHVISLDSDSEAIAACPSDDLQSDAMEGNLAYVIYTSGSTGRPKGVQVSHHSLLNLIVWHHRAFSVSHSDRATQLASPAFDAAVWELWPYLTAGASLHIVPDEVRAAPARLQRWLAEQEITMSFMPTPLAEAVLGQGGAVGGDELRLLLVGGDRLRRGWWPEAECAVANNYGPTEATVVSTSVVMNAGMGGEGMPPIGRPIGNTQAYVLNERMEPVPIGVVGELYVGGAGLARGYLNRPEQTAECFLPDAFATMPGARLYRTGDMVRYRADGQLEYVGRLDQQVKIRGFRIEPGEIEATLAQHEGVREVVVVAREEVPGEKQLVAYVVAQDGALPDGGELRGFLKARLPEYMVPGAFVVLAELPLTANGKVDRRALPAPDRQRMQSDKMYVAPRDYLELQFARVWEEVLGVRPIGVRDSFFDLGGHSLSAVRLMTRISLLIGHEIPLAAVFQRRTIEDLANLMREQSIGLASSTLVEIQSGGTRQPFFCVHPVGGNVFSYVALARLLGDDHPFYGLQSQGLREGETPLVDIEQMATHYLEAIRSVQPSGPYTLGGWSMGGVVAFEIAQCLQRQGEEVAMLALFDVPAPSAYRALREASEAQCVLSFAQDLGLAVEPLPLETLQQLTTEEQLGYIMQQAKLAGVVPSDSALEQTIRLFRVYQANIQALSSYAGSRYKGGITLFRASESEMNGRPEHLKGWRDLAEGGVELHEVPGTHYTMLREPHVRILAQLLKVRLEEIQATGSVQPRSPLELGGEATPTSDFANA